MISKQIKIDVKSYAADINYDNWRVPFRLLPALWTLVEEDKKKKH
jgi:hypothetical protein